MQEAEQTNNKQELGVDNSPFFLYSILNKQQMERAMKTFINSIAGVLVIVGIMAMAGSANDCDGACMETANTLGEMLLVAGVGLAMVLFGGMILLVNGQENA